MRVALSHRIALVAIARQEVLVRQAVGVSRFDRANCTGINACGAEGSGAGLTASVKAASLRQDSRMS